MQTQTQTSAQSPIALVQQLLAVHAIRREGYEKLLAAQPAADQRAAYEQRRTHSERATTQLLEELAAYGDATHSEVTPDGPFQKAWAELAARPVAEPAQVERTESLLTAVYDQALAEASGLPDSLRTLLQSQRDRK